MLNLFFIGLFSIPVFDDFFSNFSRDAVEEIPLIRRIKELTKQVAGEIWKKWRKSGDWKQSLYRNVRGYIFNWQLFGLML